MNNGKRCRGSSDNKKNRTVGVGKLGCQPRWKPASQKAGGGKKKIIETKGWGKFRNHYKKLRGHPGKKQPPKRRRDENKTTTNTERKKRWGGGGSLIEWRGMQVLEHVKKQGPGGGKQENKTRNQGDEKAGNRRNYADQGFPRFKCRGVSGGV